jgi:hypothetical protein
MFVVYGTQARQLKTPIFVIKKNLIGLQNIGFAGSLSFSFYQILEMEQHRRLPHAEVVQLCLFHVPGWAELDPNSVEIEETDETEWHQVRSDLPCFRHSLLYSPILPFSPRLFLYQKYLA